MIAECVRIVQGEVLEEEFELLLWIVSLMEIPQFLHWNHSRFMWDFHVKQLIHEGKFDNEYQMSVTVNSQLVDLLSPLLQRVKCNSCCSSSPILVEHIVEFGIRALVGARLVDLCHIF